MQFKNFLELSESIPKTFEFDDFKVTRTQHLLKKRKNDTKPKDFKLSKNKYIHIFRKVLPLENETYSVKFKANSMYTIISFNLENKNIRIFGVISSKKNVDYSQAERVIDLGNIDF